MNQVRKEAGEKTVPNSDRIDQLLKAYNESDPYICIARARAITESYGENHGQPAIIKKARAFRNICETVPAVIYDHELIVGSSGAHRRSAGVSPSCNGFNLAARNSCLAASLAAPNPRDVSANVNVATLSAWRP